MKGILKVLILTMGLVSCGKRVDYVPTADPPVDLIRSVTVSDGTGTVLLLQFHKYDSLQRLVRINRTWYPGSSGMKEHLVLEYSRDQVIMSEWTGTMPDVVEQEVYRLNSAGLADSVAWRDIAYAKDTIPLHSMIRTYHTDGTLAGTRDTLTSVTPVSARFEYRDGNLARATYSPPIWTGNSRFSYDTAHWNSLSNACAGLSFLGRSSRNALVGQVPDSSGFYSADFSGDFNITYDAAGRISKVITSGHYSIPDISPLILQYFGSAHEIEYSYY